MQKNIYVCLQVIHHMMIILVMTNIHQGRDVIKVFIFYLNCELNVHCDLHDACASMVQIVVIYSLFMKTVLSIHLYFQFLVMLGYVKLQQFLVAIFFLSGIIDHFYIYEKLIAPIHNGPTLTILQVFSVCILQSWLVFVLMTLRNLTSYNPVFGTPKTVFYIYLY